MQRYLTTLLVLLVALAPVSALDVIVLAEDANTGDQLTATHTLDGVTQVGDPDTLFTDVTTGQIIDLTSNAQGYQAGTAEPFFDPNLATCDDQTCHFETDSSVTDCTFIEDQIYECVNVDGGIEDSFLFDNITKNVLYVNFLLPESAQNNQPPTLTAAINPDAGDAPLLVTFTYQAEDEDLIDVTIDFGDGETLVGPSQNIVSHSYTESGTYTATVTARDSEGLTATESFTIVVDNNPNPPASQLTFDDSKTYFLSVMAIDFDTGATINPATVTMGGRTETADPYADMGFVRSDTMYEQTIEANDYQSLFNEPYFDHNLDQCSGATCDLVSRDVFGRVFETSCFYDEQFTLWDCESVNNGVSDYFWYDQNTNELGMVVELVAEDTINQNTPPVVDVTATPMQGEAPLLVTFNIDIEDDGTIEEAELYFDDGDSIDIPLMTSVSHVYSGAGTFNAKVRAVDNAGLVTVVDVPIEITGEHIGNQLIFNNQVMFDVSVVAEDATTFDTINPSTITAAGNTFTATPYADFQYNSNTLFGIEANAQGYEPVEIEHYFDYQLPTCEGLTCDLQSRNLFSEVFTTHCELDQPTNVYDCTSENNGVEEQFFYDPQTNDVGVFIHLVADEVVQTNTPPTFTLSTNPTSGDAPLPVTFTPNFTDEDGIDSAFIYFGDGQSAQLQDDTPITHTYQVAGVFNIVAVVQDNDGLTSVQEEKVSISVPETPRINVQASPLQGEAPLFTTFSVQVTDDQQVESVTLDFGDGTQTPLQPFDSTGHFYNQPGTYVATLTAEDNDGFISQEQVTITVTGTSTGTAPTVDLQAIPLNGTEPLTVTFNATFEDEDGIQSANIDFGDGTQQAISSGVPTQNLYLEGTYTATVTVIDNTGETTKANVTITAQEDTVTPGPQNQFDVEYLVVDELFTPIESAFVANQQSATLNGAFNVFQNQNANDFLSYTANAPGFTQDTYQLILNEDLPSCTAQTCTLSGTVQNQQVQTTCEREPVFQEVYFCETNHQQGQEFIFDPQAGLASIVILLEEDATTPPSEEGNISISMGVSTTSNQAPARSFVDYTIESVLPIEKATLRTKGGTFFDERELPFNTGVEELFLYNNAEYTATITVTDSNGDIATKTLTFTLQEPQMNLPEEEPEEAGIFVRSLHVENADNVQAGDYVTIQAAFENSGDFKLKNAKLIASMPELGLRQSTGSDTLYQGQNRRETLQLLLPQNIQPGTYWVRIQLKADGIDRVIHREITVSQPKTRQEVSLIV